MEPQRVASSATAPAGAACAAWVAAGSPGLTGLTFLDLPRNFIGLVGFHEILWDFMGFHKLHSASQTSKPDNETIHIISSEIGGIPTIST